MPKTALGETRGKILAWVRDQCLLGASPSVREVQQYAGLRSPQSAQEHLDRLVDEGKLVKTDAPSRPYRLPERGTLPLFAVPILGQVAAGELTEAIQDPDGYVGMVSRLPPDQLFGLRIRGDSMIRARIYDGDLVIVHRRPTADDGQIVVARVDSEATCKRLRIIDGVPQLHAENGRYRPIVPEPGELEILGVVVEVRREVHQLAAAV